ncbi:hypothetical protein [Chelatococcus sp.]|uniref:hypothetical protein n=1 Tax=Chelatococcus sp. TaxID=1953771 RepID=UPI001EB64764|nr:hypothetical protein [Chelatococcus sp.]MBX3543609.1 hypothetical protein [Chelatococcus sp.]
MTDANERKKAYMRQWRAANRERVLEQNRAWKKNNRVKLTAYARQYYENNKEKCREDSKHRVRKYRETPQFKTYLAEYLSRPDVIKANNKRAKEWRRNNRETYNAYKRELYARMKASKARNKLIPIGEALNAALGQNTLYAVALAAVPRTLPHHVREDVISDLVLAVLEGEIAEADLARVAKSFISKHYRDSGFHTTRSLDAPIPGMDGRTYLDTISTEHAGAFL